MTIKRYQLTNPSKKAFARTNAQTIAQRGALLQQWLPNIKSIAELCCGDCSAQWQHYTEALAIPRFVGLDIDPKIVAANRRAGIDCVSGNVLDAATLQQFSNIAVVFYGPPLSVECDGHRALPFAEITPGYWDFAKVFLGQLGYRGTLVCICPNTTTLGDAQQLYRRIRSVRPDMGLFCTHYSHSTVTGSGAETERRLKYVELWFSSVLEDEWRTMIDGIEVCP